MKKLKDILQEDCWKGYKQYGMKEKDGKQVPNCVPIDEATSTNEYEPYMYSPVGFSCKVCKFADFNKDEDRWVCSNTDYQDYQKSKGIEESRAHYLLDNNGNPITDPSKWCSNWFKPNT